MIRLLSNLTIACVLLSASAFGQAPLPAEVEGPISSVTKTATGANVVVMGMTVVVGSTTTIETPAGPLTIDQFTDQTPLPGRSEEGFEGGTAIVEGTVDPATSIITAAKLTVEPGENVILGVVTANNGGNLTVNGVKVLMISDARMKAAPVRNEFGFDVQTGPDSITIGMPVSVEGYFDGTNFQAFLVEVDGPAKLVDPNPQISIVRAQTRERRADRGDDVEIRGAVTTTHVSPTTTSQTITIFRVDKNSDGTEKETFLRTAFARIVPGSPGVALWSFSGQTPPSTDPILGKAPTTLRAYNNSISPNPPMKTKDAEVRGL